MREQIGKWGGIGARFLAINGDIYVYRESFVHHLISLRSSGFCGLRGKAILILIKFLNALNYIRFWNDLSYPSNQQTRTKHISMYIYVLNLIWNYNKIKFYVNLLPPKSDSQDYPPFFDLGMQSVSLHKEKECPEKIYNQEAQVVLNNNAFAIGQMTRRSA